MDKKAQEEALQKMLGISPEDVRTAFHDMAPLDVGIFRRKPDYAELSGGNGADGPQKRSA